MRDINFPLPHEEKNERDRLGKEKELRGRVKPGDIILDHAGHAWYVQVNPWLEALPLLRLDSETEAGINQSFAVLEEPIEIISHRDIELGDDVV